MYKRDLQNEKHKILHVLKYNIPRKLKPLVCEQWEERESSIEKGTYLEVMLFKFCNIFAPKHRILMHG